MSAHKEIKVAKFFNTAGPVNPEKHYCLPLDKRLKEQELRLLIEQEKYFILHAPRQTGKTSIMLDLVKKLNKEGVYTALYVNIESGQAARGNVEKGLLTILKQFKNSIELILGNDNPGMQYFKEKELTIASISGNELGDFLQFWCQRNSKPIILFIDEIDALVGDTLLSVLRQLRAGYTNRPSAFPQTVCLIGLRDVRDYRIWSEEQNKMILGGSAFNIKAESLRLADFTKEEVKALYAQHTQETGQKFEKDALDYAFEVTQGQPWLINALAYQACFKDVQDRSLPITKEILVAAKETLIRRRDTHIDALVDKLQEPRVRNIIDAILTGNIKTAEKLSTDDILYARDLGLIKAEKGLEIANPIYQEIIPRELTYAKQQEMIQDIAWYKDPNGTLNITKLLNAFTLFYSENSADWLVDCDYKESGPHLLLMAFLQRVINGGGRIHREYALGSGRVDVEIFYKPQRIIIEIKIWYGEKKTLIEGLEQTAKYMDTARATEGHLVIFDKANKSWDEKIYTRQERVGNKTITVWGM